MEWCCEGTTGVKEDGNTPAARNQGGGANSPAAVLSEIPAVAWAGVAGEELAELPGGGAKLMRGLAEAGVWRSSRSTVE
jgi:hypothetical protein